MRIGITGQSGFIGSYLHNYLGIDKKYKIIDFDRSYFDDEAQLQKFVNNCDVIIHLAGVNRHGNPEMVHDENIRLAKTLISALEKCAKAPSLIYSSSIQEHQDNIYGRAKKEARNLFENWAEENNANFCGLIIPNVFGPFGNPFYNSVIATFCYQFVRDITPTIQIDKQLPLIYVGELVEEIKKIIDNGSFDRTIELLPTREMQVSDLLVILKSYKSVYFDSSSIPILSDKFEVNLFNTFRSYINIGEHYPVPLTVHTDDRGGLFEIVKEYTGGQTFFSTTKPNITRGNHYHTRKIERFCVVKGEALIKLRKVGTSQIHEFKVLGNSPSFIDIPIWYVHNITNVGDGELLTLFWCNEIFDQNDTDTYFETV